MTQFLTNLGFPAATSLLLLFPFLLLEVANRSQTHAAFPYPLFLGLWLLQAAFMLLLKPVLQSLRAGRLGERQGMLFLSASCLLLIA